MGFYVRHIAVLSATFFFLVQSQPSNVSKHNEIHRARSQIDSLIYKLTLDLNNFIQKKNLAHATEKEAQRLARIAQEEIAVLTPVQHVLEKLAKGNTYSGYLCSTTRSGKIKVGIEAKGSQLPKHYTIAIPGKKIMVFYVIRQFHVWPRKPKARWQRDYGLFVPENYRKLYITRNAAKHPETELSEK